MVLNVPVFHAASTEELQFKHPSVFFGLLYTFLLSIVFIFLISNASRKGNLLLFSTSKVNCIFRGNCLTVLKSNQCYHFLKKPQRHPQNVPKIIKCYKCQRSSKK